MTENFCQRVCKSSLSPTRSSPNPLSIAFFFFFAQELAFVAAWRSASAKETSSRISDGIFNIRRAWEAGARVYHVAVVRCFFCFFFARTFWQQRVGVYFNRPIEIFTLCQKKKKKAETQPVGVVMETGLQLVLFSQRVLCLSVRMEITAE